MVESEKTIWHCWHADWWVTCWKCYSQEFMDGATLTQAKATARKEGWKIVGGKATCPRCQGGNNA